MNNELPLTVLLPAYNAAPYLREAVDSVLAQTFRNFELLIINDGSTDTTGEILATYKDERIKVVTQENMGLIATLNKGLSIAKGKYIARFDADDICYPERLQLQYDFMVSNPEYVIIGGEGDYVEEDGTFIYTYKFKAYEDDEIRRQGSGYCPFIHSAVMFVKDAVIDAGGYNAGAVTFEDHMLWWKLAAKGKMKNMERPLIKVRFNSASVTIDERWRGAEFKRIKYEAIEKGEISEKDAEALKQLLARQNFNSYKEAAYYSMIGKKFLWNNYQPAKARKNIRRAIALTPLKWEPYFLYVLSFLGENTIQRIYKTIKEK